MKFMNYPEMCSPQHYSAPYGGSLLLSHAQNDCLGLQESWCAGR